MDIRKNVRNCGTRGALYQGTYPITLDAMKIAFTKAFGIPMTLFGFYERPHYTPRKNSPKKH